MATFENCTWRNVTIYLAEGHLTYPLCAQWLTHKAMALSFHYSLSLATTLASVHVFHPSVLLYCSSPCCFWPPNFQFPFRLPCRGNHAIVVALNLRILRSNLGFVKRNREMRTHISCLTVQ